MSSLAFRCAAVLAWLAATSSPPVRAGSDLPDAREVVIAGRRALVVETGGARESERLPMIVALHSSGSRPEEILADFTRAAVPARVVIPQGGFARRQGWSWFPEGYGALAPAEARLETFRQVDELAAWLAAAQRELRTLGLPIVAGISYGGDLAVLLAVHRPDTVSAAFPIAARFLPEWMPEAPTFVGRGPWIVAYHGEADPTVPIGPTREAVGQLRRLGYQAELRGFAGVGHDFDAAMRADLGRALAGRILGDPGP